MDLLPRLHERLIASLAATPDPRAPLTVGDIYQRLIAYRSVRNELGVMELASYEHALLRLLAGEGGLVRLLDQRATDEIRRELDSVNPIVGVYRDFAEIGVEVRRDVASERAPGATASGLGDATSPGDAGAGRSGFGASGRHTPLGSAAAGSPLGSTAIDVSGAEYFPSSANAGDSPLSSGAGHPPSKANAGDSPLSSGAGYSPPSRNSAEMPLIDSAAEAANGQAAAGGRIEGGKPPPEHATGLVADTGSGVGRAAQISGIGSGRDNQPVAGDPLVQRALRREGETPASAGAGTIPRDPASHGPQPPGGGEMPTGETDRYPYGTQRPAETSPIPAFEAGVTRDEEHELRTASARPSTQRCVACGRRLPHLREIRFCPYCGTACPPRACSVCATPLEGGWSFCVCCGTPAVR